MKFFTPDLLARYNSPNEEIADIASDQWGAARDAYGRIVEQLRQNIQVQQLLDIDFHDAIVDFMGGRGLIFSIYLRTEEGSGFEVVYLLADSLSWIQHPSFPAARVLTWWYDEIEELKDCSFVHSILLSSGVELHIPFVKATVRTFEGFMHASSAGHFMTAQA